MKVAQLICLLACICLLILHLCTNNALGAFFAFIGIISSAAYLESRG